jgi:hypothetical protein
MLRTILTTLALACTVAGCIARDDDHAVSVTLCHAAASADQLNGRLIRVRAFMESDATHYTRLSDPSCKGQSLSVSWASANASPRLVAILDAVFAKAEHPGTLDQEVSGLFEGIVHCETAELRSCSVELTDVDAVRIQPRSDSPFAPR